MVGCVGIKETASLDRVDSKTVVYSVFVTTTLVSVSEAIAPLAGEACSVVFPKVDRGAACTVDELKDVALVVKELVITPVTVTNRESELGCVKLNWAEGPTFNLEEANVSPAFGEYVNNGTLWDGAITVVFSIAAVGFVDKVEAMLKVCNRDSP